MSAPDSATIMLLTEHFGFPPISLIDDIINSVNEILYKCTGALEKYLDSKRKNLELEANEEIEIGTSKIETLFESNVDKNFDLFELYTLRNVINVPKELIEDGWFRLEHYKEIENVSGIGKKNKELESKIEEVELEIKIQLEMREKVQSLLARANKIVKSAAELKSQIRFLSTKSTRESPISREALASLKSLAPLNESIFFLKSECDTLYSDTNQLEQQFNEKIRGKQFKQSQRDVYINTRSSRMMKLVEENEEVVVKFNVGDPTGLKTLNQKLGDSR